MDVIVEALADYPEKTMLALPQFQLRAALVGGDNFLRLDAELGDELLEQLEPFPCAWRHQSVLFDIK